MKKFLISLSIIFCSFCCYAQMLSDTQFLGFPLSISPSNLLEITEPLGFKLDSVTSDEDGKMWTYKCNGEMSLSEMLYFWNLNFHFDNDNNLDFIRVIVTPFEGKSVPYIINTLTKDMWLFKVKYDEDMNCVVLGYANDDDYYLGFYIFDLSNDMISITYQW